MPTNLLSLPLLSVTFETATNESWRDGVAFATAGSVAPYANSGNTGSGTVSSASVTAGAYIGDYTVTMTGPTTFGFQIRWLHHRYGCDRRVVFCVRHVPHRNVGGDPFAAGDGFTLTVLPQPIDLTGIRFVMQMRTASASAQILISGDTNDGTLVNGETNGVLGIAIPQSEMARVPVSAAGSPYVLDIVGIADGDQLRCVTGTNTVVLGITIPAC